MTPPVPETPRALGETTYRLLQRVRSGDPHALEALFQRYGPPLRRGRRAAREALSDALAADEPSPLEAAIGRQALDRYERALEQLKPREREAIIARVELGCSYSEVAEALARPTADAARRATERALIRLAEIMSRDL